MIAFCENCRKKVEATIKEEDMSHVIKGKEIHYKGKEAYCPICSDELFIHELRDENLRNLKLKYIESEGE